MGPVAFRMLGGLVAGPGTGPVDLGTRKQRAVLAALLLAEGRPLTTDRLSDVLWGDAPPDRAEASLQAYVSGLRRVLEPDRPPRAPARLLVTRGPGYALLADRADVDAWRFVDTVDEARRHFEAGDPRAAGDLLGPALDGWAPLLPEFDGEPFRTEAAEHLDRVHEAAVRLSFEVRTALGESRLLAAELEAAVARHPLDEDLWALLALARYRLGRQGDALAAVADARRLLADELGVDPGPRLRRLEADLLAQAPHLAAPAPAEPQAPAAAPAVPAAAGGRATLGRDGRPIPRTPGGSAVGIPHPAIPRSGTPLVGRTAELGVLTDAVASAAAGGTVTVVVEGEPGAGKTRLLEETTHAAVDRGAIVLWGRCVEDEGTPTMWPWVQAVGELLDALDDEPRRYWLDGDLGRLLAPAGPDGDAVAATLVTDPAAQFRMFTTVARVVREVAALRPVVLVVDDLQWADDGSLALFEHLAGQGVPGTLLLGALRDRAPVPAEGVVRLLAAVSRAPGHRRVRVGALSEGELAELVEHETGRPLEPERAARLHERTGGNPFFAREVARLVVDRSGDTTGLPAGVRDVVRSRMAALPAATRSLLQVAAVVGRSAPYDVLARASGHAVDAVLDLLEPLDSLGLASPDDPFAFRFAHDLVREAVAESTPAARVARTHLAVADALEALAPDGTADPERLAHHLWAAGPLADRVRTAGALLAAARRAVAKHAGPAAVRQLASAAELARTAGADQVEYEALTLLALEAGMQSGWIAVPQEPLERGAELAHRLGDELAAAHFVYLRWSGMSQSDDRAGAARLAARLAVLARTLDEPVVRLYAEHARTLQCWDAGDVEGAFAVLGEVGATVDEVLTSIAAGRLPLSPFGSVAVTPALLGLAQLTAFSGDVTRARAIFEQVEKAVDGWYEVTLWAVFAGTVAAQVGDPQWARRVTARCLADVGEGSRSFMDTFVGVADAWATAHLGATPQERLRAAATLRALDEDRPPGWSGGGMWTVLLAEAWFAAGDAAEALAALDRAESEARSRGQRHVLTFAGLVRARVLLATGTAPADEVRALAERTRDEALAQGGRLVADRVERLLAELPEPIA